jgi:hypothetical protein
MNNITALLLKPQQKFPHSIGLIITLLLLSVISNWQPATARTLQQVQPVETLVHSGEISLTDRLRQWRTTNRFSPVASAGSPTQLRNLFAQLDAAATRGNIKEVMELYSPNFRSTDGLNYQSLQQSLIAFWKRYPNLRYSTRLESWQVEGNTIVAETVTNIIGLSSTHNNNFTLNATITSRQRIQDTKIVEQEILSERSVLTSGEQPPKIDINLPQQVRLGQTYYFDAIVREPLGDDLLLGTAIEEPVQVGKYLNPTSVDLERLTSGGLFKIGRAPAIPGDRWVSAVIVRSNGTTIITQRLQVVR